jgi:hypothetical protein
MKDKPRTETKKVHPVEEKFSMETYGICEEDVTQADLAFIASLDWVTEAQFKGYGHLVVTITPKKGTTSDAVTRHRAAVRSRVSTLLYSIPKRQVAAERVEAGRFVAEHPHYID